MLAASVEKPEIGRGRPAWHYRLMAAGMTLAAVAFVLWRAWICDDAFITFRHVQNCLAGYGPVFNPGERVQAFTHPLWFLLLLSGAGLHVDIYAFTVALSLVLTAGTMLALAYQLRHCEHREILLPLVIAFLCSSPAFVEFQTSGLENSLTNLLVVLVCGGILFGRCDSLRPWRVSLGCALLLCDRPDKGFLCLPLLVWAVLDVSRRRGRGMPGLVLGAIPAIAWYGFATLYYGTPLPNSFYTKVTGGLSQTLFRGAYYLYDYACAEPLHAGLMLLCLVIGIACAAADLRERRPGAGLRFCVVLGIVLHLVYVVGVGGDYMRGRFMVTPLTATALLGVFLLDRLAPRFDLPRAVIRLAIASVPVALFLRFAGYLAIGPMSGFMSLRVQPLAVRCLLGASLALWVITALAVRRRWNGESRAFPSAVLTAGFVALLAAAGFWNLNLALALWMAGGLLSASLLMMYTASGEVSHRVLQPLALLCVAGLSITRPYGSSEVNPVDHGISDEYCWYAGEWRDPRFTRPARGGRGEWWNWASIAEKARRYSDVYGPVCMVHEALGIFSYDAGPNVRVLDILGLADAFVARCSARDASRTGHIAHDVPLSYLRARGAINLLPDWEVRLEALDPTLRRDALEMMQAPDWDDPEALQKWDAIRAIIAGPVLSPERLRLLPGFIVPRRLSPAPQARRVPADLRSALPSPIVPPKEDGKYWCEALGGPFRQTTPSLGF